MIPLDPSWLFLGAGVALIGSAALLPAFDDLRHARYHRDRARAMERYHAERLERYGAFLGALEAGDETLMRSLASSQLNLTPEGMHLMIFPAHDDAQRADVFTGLDPVYRAPVEPPRVGSRLERWALDQTGRLWLLAGGACATLIGVLPVARRRNA